MKRKRIQQAGVLVLLGSGLFLLLESLPAHAQDSNRQKNQSPERRTPAARLTPADPPEVSLDPARLRPRRARRPEVFFCQTPEPQCRTSIDTFAVEELRDLYVFVTWPNVFGRHVQTVEFILPDGHLYQRKQLAFALRPRVRMSAAASEAPAAEGVASSQVPVVPGPLLTVSRGDPAVITVLPVAGTFITQHNLLGTWTVRVFLDDRPVLAAQLTLNSERDQ